MQIVGLFPIPVGIFHINRDLSEEEKKYLFNQIHKPNMGNTTSEERFILRHSSMADIRKFIQDSIDAYFKEIICPMKDASLYVTQSWVNYTTKGQWHHSHEHPNSILSGVFYAQSDEHDKIYFERNNYEQIQFPTEPNKWNLFNSKSWWLEATQGRLVIFPSSLRHNVNPVETDHTRISLSFNTFARGMIGAPENLTLLEVGQIYPS